MAKRHYPNRLVSWSKGDAIFYMPLGGEDIEALGNETVFWDHAAGKYYVVGKNGEAIYGDPILPIS